jgi:Rrf2 family nitric oxide-sensitive transcriptional repressor
MRLSLHTDYALRVLMYLAGADRRTKVAEIAEFFDISRDHVAKVTQRLARLGYIRAIRGAGGGLELAREPKEIQLGSVISDFEGTLQLLECVDAAEIICRIQPSCRLREVLAKAEKLQKDYLDGVRLSDVVQKSRPLDTQ